MPKLRTKTIKGMSVAIIILSALCALAYIIGGVAIAICAQYYEPIMDSINSDIYFNGGAYSFDMQGHGFEYSSPYSYGYGYVDSDAILESQMMSLIFQTGTALLVIGCIMEIFCVVAGVLILMSADKPEKLGMAFGWGIAGAIISLLSGGIIQTVLFVLAVIFIYKDRDVLAKCQFANAAPQAGQVPPVPPAGAPAYAQGAGAPQTAPVQTAPQTAPVQTAPQAAPQPVAAAPMAAQPVNAPVDAPAPSQPVSQPVMDGQSQETLQVADEMISGNEGESDQK